VAVYVLVEQPDARELYRRMARGISWAAIVAVVLGMADFAGLVSLAGYNQSHLFFGAEYRRLQSTFGNPSWFACFVACALPLVLLEWREAKHARVLLAAVFPLTAAALFLSAARAAWIAGAVLIGALAAIRLIARRRRRPFPPLTPLEWAALTASVAVFGLLVAGAYARGTASGGGSPPERLEGLSREVRIRGLGLDMTSPRRVAAQYALALAKERPLLGLGYESFNMHLRAQLALPGSPVCRVVNTAVAQDAAETVFDDSHNTYLQALTGTGVLGLVLWLCFATAALASGVYALLRDPAPTPAALVVGMLVFHVYGFFQGMAYVPATFFLVFLEAGYAVVIAPVHTPGRLAPAGRFLLPALAAAVLAAAPLQAWENGYPSLERALGVTSYLPDESAEFEGFYRAETGPAGEFRWMARRGIVNVARAAPFRLAFTCQHPDLERDPVVVSLRFEHEDVGSIVCRQPGTLEKRFAPGSPGALRVSVSRTFRPGGSDRRELGVAVSAIRWE
jgi:O-antigen ligase